MKKDIIAFYLILLIGTIARLISITASPITVEELKLVSYLANTSFNELVGQGLKMDMQPALLRLFGFFWIKIFGSSLLSIRFPFFIFGILSIYCVYRYAAELIGNFAALFVAGTMAVSAFFITHGQHMQVHLLGTFLLYLFLYYFILYLKGNQKLKLSIFIILTASISIISHYFVSLIVLCMLIVAYFFHAHSYKKKYFVHLAFIALLCLPHAFISLHQLSLLYEGNWILWKPSHNFWDFLQLIYNRNIIFFGISPLIFIFSLIFFRQRAQYKWTLTALSIFVLSYVLNVFLSEANSSIFYSNLVFSSPLLLIYIYSFSTFKLRKKLGYSFLGILLLLGIYSLSFLKISEAENPKSNYQLLSERIKLYQDSLGVENFHYILHTEHPEYYNHFLPKALKATDREIYQFNNYEAISDLMVQLKDSLAKRYLILLYDDSLMYETMAVIGQNYLPLNDYTLKDQSLILFEKTAAKGQQHFSLLHDLEKYIPNWEVAMQQRDSTVFFSEKYSLKITPATEYAMTYKDRVGNMFSGQHQFLSTSIMLKMAKKLHCKLVISLHRGDQLLHWNSYPLDSYYKASRWFEAHFVYQLPSDIKAEDHIYIYLWNPEKNSLWVDDFELTTFNDSRFSAPLLK